MFHDQLLEATLTLADAAEWYSAPERLDFLELDLGDVKALRRACCEAVAVDEDGHPALDSKAMLRLLQVCLAIDDKYFDLAPDLKLLEQLKTNRVYN